MKKIYLSLLAAAGILFSSCDMDLPPVGPLDEEDAIDDIEQLAKLRNGIYNNMRSVVTGGFLYYTEIQMDQFLGLVNNGNQLGTFAHGNIFSNNSDIESVWASLYSRIADANYLLETAEKFLDNPDLTQDEIDEIERYVGETKFARAYYYYYLLDHWSDTYNAATADKAAGGVPVVTKFNPTSNIYAYPGRSTVNETYALIDQDLEDAYNALKTFEGDTGYRPVPMDYYVNSYVVRALQARLAFMRSDWQTTIDYCNEIIDSRIYTLANVNNYTAMWQMDNNNEIIFQPYSTDTELGISSTGAPYVSASQQSALYIPTNEVLEMYDSNDIRYDAFFTVYYLLVYGQEYQAYVFNKFPGNPNLNSSERNDIMNMGKPFRLSETYLMLAEASYEMNDATTANTTLNTLRKARLKRMLGNPTYSGVELRDQIRLERTKELIGEGFRMSDLRRWGLGFTRDGSYPQNPDVESLFVLVDTQVEYNPGDYRYVWPIPSGEMENNPQIRNQQNPGY